MSAYALPLPYPTDDSRPFWEACRQHTLKLQRCAACRKFRFQPEAVCPHCLSLEFTWEAVSGRGSIYAVSVVRQPFSDAWKEVVPYVVAVIQLAEGPKMVSNVVGCPPESVRIGQEVEVVFEDVTEEFTLPKFRLREEAR